MGSAYDKSMLKLSVLDQSVASYGQPQDAAIRPDALAGTAAQVAHQLSALAARLELDELVVCSWAHDPSVQSRSFELLAEVFELPVNSC